MTPAHKELELRIAEVEKDFSFVLLAHQLRPRLGSVVNWGLGSAVTSLPKSFIDSKEFRIEPITGFLLVRLLSSFERYIRKFLEASLEAYSSRNKNFSLVNDHIRARNIALTGALLASLESPRDHITISSDTLIQNLATCINGNQSYKLNIQAFSASNSGAGPNSIERSLSNIGIKDFWDTVGADGGLAAKLNTKGSRETGKASRKRLEEVWRWRNNLVHGGDTEISLTESEFKRAMEFIRAFSKALDGLSIS